MCPQKVRIRLSAQEVSPELKRARRSRWLKNSATGSAGGQLHESTEQQEAGAGENNLKGDAGRHRHLGGKTSIHFFWGVRLSFREFALAKN
jgi:hypothetical protein